MTIPFVRQYPNGRRSLAEITCTPIVENIAKEFIAKGGAYLCEIMPDGRARIAACLFVDDTQKDVEESLVENGPALEEAVTRLIIRSVKHVSQATRH